MGVPLTERDRWICEQVAPRLREMGLLFVSHRSCGYSSDGIGYLGGDPPVIEVSDTLKVRVPAGFSTSYSLESIDEHGAALTEVETDELQTFAIDVPESGCYRLNVDVVKGDLQGRWESRLDVDGGGCPQAKP